MKTTTTTLLSLLLVTSMSFANLFGPQPEDLKVKGLYIGMPIDDALVASKKAVEGTSISHWADEMKIEKFDDGTSNIVFKNAFGMPLFMVVADNTGKVGAFAFEWPAVNVMFNAEDMELREFAQMFINAYNIPELKPDDKRENFICTMECGIKVTITKDKGVAIAKTQTETERKAAFN